MMKIEEGTARKPWPCNHNGCKKKIAKGQAYYLSLAASFQTQLKTASGVSSERRCNANVRLALSK